MAQSRSNEAPAGSRPWYLLPQLRREQNPSEAEISSHSSSNSRSGFFISEKQRQRRSLRVVTIAKGDKGIALIELLIAVAISSIIIGLALQVMALVRTSFLSSNIRFVSKDLLDSTADIVRSIKELSWDSLGIDGTYHPELAGGLWTLVSGDELVTGTQFTRSVQILSICRDTSLLITDCSSGINDPDSKQIIINISWIKPISGSISTTQLITRHANNGFWSQSTQSEFESGATANTLVTANAGGQIDLEGNVGPGWAASSRASNINITNSQLVNSIAIYKGRLFIVKNNDPGGQEFLIYDISNPRTPSLISASELGSDGKKIIVSGGFAYVATSDDSQELKIFNISDPTSPLPIGNLNLAGTADATNLAISDSRLYLIRVFDGVEKEFNTINITNAAIPELISSQDFSDTISDIFIDGRYAYLSTNIDSQEVIVIDLSIDLPAENIVGTYDIAGNENTSAISFSFPYIYISSLQNKIYILSAITPASISEASQISLSGISDIYIADKKGFFTDGSSALGMYTYDLTNPASPSLIGNHSIGSNATNVITVGAYAFVATQSSSREVIVVQGGGTNYVTNGEFYSQTFNTQNVFTEVQSIGWNATTPSTASVSFQIAINSRGYGFEYVGPDGTPSTYYQTQGSYPLVSTPGQYIKVKVILNGDGTETSNLDDFRITYI